MLEQQAFQFVDDGANPISALQISDLWVEPCRIEDVASFIRRWHYSGSVNGIKSDYCFRLIHKTDFRLIGAAVFGSLAMANQWRKYSERETDIMELRRLCCIDDTPSNVESFFISKCLRWLKKWTSLKLILSYSDLDFGHTGTIYRASNFQLVGQTGKGRIILWQGRRYHDKAIRTKHNGKLKPFAASLKQALATGDAVYRGTSGKMIYLYKLR